MKALVAPVLACLLILTGCATTVSRKSYLKHIEPNSITNFTAYCAANTLDIRYPLRDKHVFAHATWAPIESTNAPYQCRFSVLTLDKKTFAERKRVVVQKNRLVIRGAAQWKTLLQSVFLNLAPQVPGHGVLLLAQDMEIVVLRNKAGEVKVVNLDSKPSDIIIDHTFSDADFSKEAISLLASSAGAMDPHKGQFLFMTGEDPAFVLVDLPAHLVIFLAYPADSETQPIAISRLFALRVLNSLLIKSLIVTAVKNPVSLTSCGLWHLGISGMTLLNSFSITAADPPPPPLYTGPTMDMAAWEKELDGVVTSRRHQGRVQLFVDGSQFFPALVQSIETAKQNVDVMVYIFDTDNFAVKMADVLKQRSDSVRVRVLMDDIGSLFGEGAPASDVPPNFQAPADIESYLAAGAHVHVRAGADPWLATNHRKCFIIDGRQAYLGGMNIGWVYRYQWHDMMVGLTGPVVGQLEKDYQKAWALAGPFGDFAYAWAAIFDRKHLRRNPVPGSIDVRVLHTATGEMQIYHAQLEAIRHAKRYIYIENAYFNDNTMLRALIQARQRGVDVRVILGSESDVGIMQTGNMVTANEMIRNGIRVFIYPGMTHVKAAIYDGWACVGSANMEKMSLRVSQELDVAFSDPATVGQLDHQLFEADFKRSAELKSPAELNWTDSFLKAIGEQL
ncbi:MAG TPA: phosphatidylserine/phosphatidylglycerophosphate/cardiolipin synthase family protein [Verrucomicrobiae bacterium]|jgi:cardiolipin synthase|nr:phosphatidylserine/phosphatidylglycerophosphate/cardiolipin synthase family protein [Verrucomicrobiae bacterium]